MSDPTCPSCVELFSVHRPTNWIRCWLITSGLFVLSFVFLLFASTQSIALILIVATPLCFVCCAVFHLLRCSHFLISVDSTGLVHLHKRNQPALDAQLVIEVRAGAIRRQCKLHWDNSDDWKISASNEHFFFTDQSGDTFSVRYCAMPNHSATGYVSRYEPALSDTLRLIKQWYSVDKIRHLALQQTEASREDSPVAGSISANQG